MGDAICGGPVRRCLGVWVVDRYRLCAHGFLVLMVLSYECMGMLYMGLLG
jgi:hypothetical protein